jgi:putative cardiolipin synthase
VTDSEFENRHSRLQRRTRERNMAETTPREHALTESHRVHRILCWPGVGLIRALAVAAMTLNFGCTPARLDVPRAFSYAIERPENTELGRLFSKQLATAPGQSGVHLLVSGKEAFAARAGLTESAQRTLDLQYYIVAHDATATLLLYRALRAAQRGVRVRLLIDDMNLGLRDADLAILARHPNVEVRMFNPFTFRALSNLARLPELLGDRDRLNRRMHNKLWVVDNAVAIMGGRNLADTYFDVASESGFGDLDVLVAGPAVSEISRSFDLYWNSELAVPIAALISTATSANEADRALVDMAARAEQFSQGDYARTLREARFGNLLRTGQVTLIPATATVLYDLPGHREAGAGEKTGPIFLALRQIVERAQHEVLVVSPYLVPSDRSLELICGLTRRGVRVRILTNSLASTDVPAVHAGYARYRPGLLACGVELHERRPADGTTRVRSGFSSGASLHAKAVVVDRQLIFLGSMNLDPRSRRLNSEVALRVESAEIGQQLGNLFDEGTSLDQAFLVALTEPGNASAALRWESFEDGRHVFYTGEPMASLWRRIFTPILGAFTPEDLL